MFSLSGVSRHGVELSSASRLNNERGTKGSPFKLFPS